MNKYGLIGENISFSKSPELHKVIAKVFNFKIEYKLYDISKESILSVIYNKGIKGFNITTPYKKLVFQMTNKNSLISEKIGAINTLFFKDNLLYGDNTDYYGFLTLLNYYKINLTNKRILILGTGGAALSVYYSCKQFNCNVLFVSRNKANKKMPSEVINYKEIVNYKYDVIINATPIGVNSEQGSPLEISLVKNKIVIDLIYNPLKTKLMSYSKTSYNGLIMLIAQALYAHKLWGNINIEINNQLINKVKELLLSE